MMIKKKTITQVLVMKKLIKNLKNGALSKVLYQKPDQEFLKSTISKKYLIKNLKKVPYNETLKEM